MQKINFDCSEKLKSFNQPVLIILGEEDIIKKETAEKAKNILKNSKLVFVEHSIHYAWLDNEKFFLKK